MDLACLLDQKHKLGLIYPLRPIQICMPTSQDPIPSSPLLQVSLDSLSEPHSTCKYVYMHVCVYWLHDREILLLLLSWLAMTMSLSWHSMYHVCMMSVICKLSQVLLRTAKTGDGKELRMRSSQPQSYTAECQ